MKTQKKKTLYANDEQFRLMFYRHNAIMLLIEPESGQILDANLAAEKFYGYKIDELCRMSITEINILPPEEVAAEWNLAITEKRNYFVFPHRLANSEIRTVEVHSSPVTIGDKQLLFSIIHDITERKRAEDALRNSESRYRAIFETAREGICQIDEKFNITLLNQRMADMLGYTVEEIRGRSLSDFIIGCDMENILQLKAEQRQNLLEKFDWRVRHKDGSELWAIVSGKPVMTDDNNFSYGVVMITDITERKHAENALKESEIRYRNLFDNANMGIFQTALNGKVIMVNRKFARMFGYESSEGFRAAINDVGAEIFADPQRRAEIIRLNAENSDLNEFENLYLKKDGSTFWGQLNVRSIKDSENNILYMEGFIKDITERKRAEEQLRESRQILQTMIDANPEIVLLIDSNGVSIAANQPVASRLGKTIPEIIGKKIYNLLPRDIAERRRKIIEKVIRTGEKTLFEDQSGEKYFLNMLVPISDDHGQVKQVFIMAVDITERKHIENAVRQNGEQYRSFVETMNDGFIVVDKNMEVAYVNEKFCRMTGYEKEEIVGIRFLHYFDEDNQKIVEEQFMKRRSGKTSPYQVEFVRKDKSRMFINVSPKPVYDSDGVFHGSFAVITDITTRKEAETMRIMEQQAMQEQSAIIDKLNTEVEEYNHALKVLLKNSQNEQKAVEENIVSNVREMVMPFFEKLKKTHLSETQKNLLEGIEINMKHIVSPFVIRLKAELRDLTPMEIQVANLVREGKSNIEIGDILGVSENTAMFHRRNIRKKFGLQHQGVNLRTYLLSLSAPS